MCDEERSNKDRRALYLCQAQQDVLDELKRAAQKFGSFASAHEGYAILLEEVDELWDAVRMHGGADRQPQLYTEAVQVAAMALEFLIMLKCQAEDADEST